MKVPVMYVQFEQMCHARVMSVLTTFRLCISGINGENFERRPLNVGLLYTEMSKLLTEW